MKQILFLILVVQCLTAFGQAKRSFESKIIIVQWYHQPGGGLYGGDRLVISGYHKWPNKEKTVPLDARDGVNQHIVGVVNELNRVISEEENDAFHLVQIETTLLPNTDIRTGKAMFHFDRPSSYLDQEMKALRLELTQRIDARTKRMADSTVAAVNQNVLNYLKAIPDDVITKAYKDNLTKQLEEYAKASFESMKDEVLKELRNNP